jgi:hypothetical protein
MSSNLDKLRGVLGIVGGRESEVLGIAIKRIKELEGTVEQLEGQLTEQGQQLERTRDKTD